MRVAEPQKHVIKKRTLQCEKGGAMKWAWQRRWCKSKRKKEHKQKVARACVRACVRAVGCTAMLCRTTNWNGDAARNGYMCLLVCACVGVRGCTYVHPVPGTRQRNEWMSMPHVLEELNDS